MRPDHLVILLLALSFTATVLVAYLMLSDDESQAAAPTSSIARA